MRRIDRPADSHYSILFLEAMRVVDSVGQGLGVAMPWRWGGGTVMMLRHGHRDSKDIDIFVDDPQHLNYLNPDLNDTVGNMTEMCVQQANFVKLYLPQGEIDFVVAPTLTQNPVEEALFNGRSVLLETDVEIVAKKLWFRCDDFTGRDVFDLHWLAKHEPNAITILRNFGDKLARIGPRLALSMVKDQFENVAALQEPPTYAEVVEQLQDAFPEVKVPEPADSVSESKLDKQITPAK